MAASLTAPARQWWTQGTPAALQTAQDRLLSRWVAAPHVRLPVTAGLNSVVFGDAESSSQRTIVLAHGFGSGLGFFYHNIDGLLQITAPGTNAPNRVVAVDWMGMGGSERPPCRAAPIRWNKACFCDAGMSASQAIDFFVDPFHEWMNKVVLKAGGDGPVTLVGHSLGGYLAARYVTKYARELAPRLDTLILASPVGFAPRPNEASLLSGAQLPTPLRLLDALWSRNLTPQQLVRLMGATYGRRNVHRVLRARMPQLPASDVELLADYFYQITVAPPSGEFAMNSLLEPVVTSELMGVLAREPLDASTLVLPSSLRTLRVLYGDHDWMRPSNEVAARRVVDGLRQQLSHASVDILSNAGHHLYLESPGEFTRLVVS